MNTFSLSSLLTKGPTSSISDHNISLFQFRSARIMNSFSNDATSDSLCLKLPLLIPTQRSAEGSPTTNSENHNNNVDSEAHRNDEETNDLPKTRNESLSHSPSDGPPTPSSPGPSPSSPFIILHTPADSSSSSSSPPTSSSSSSSPSYLASLGRRLPSPSDFCDGLKNNLCSFFRRRILVSAMGVPLSHAFVQVS